MIKENVILQFTWLLPMYILRQKMRNATAESCTSSSGTVKSTVARL